MNQDLSTRAIAPNIAPDFAAIKQRQQATWASDDFSVIGITLQIVGESLAEAVDVRAGEQVLDVAAGNGNATLAAARRFAQLTSTDYVRPLLDKGRERAPADDGPTHKAFAALDSQGQQALERDITTLLEAMNTAGPHSLVVPGEYLELVVTKR